MKTQPEKSMFERRGVVLSADDLVSAGERWVEWMTEAGLNLLGLHDRVDSLVAFAGSGKGEKLLDRFRAAGIQIEYEMHACYWLVPRLEFARHPEWFRMEEGRRRPDANFCPSNPEALQVAAENARRLAELLRPTTGRYYLWSDDGWGWVAGDTQWCRCPACKGLSASDQNLTVMNAIVGGLRKIDPAARLAFLAYSETMARPTTVAPAPGIFLEFAPCWRKRDVPLEDRNTPEHAKLTAVLDDLLRCFGADAAQVLEYWLDGALFFREHHPRAHVKIPFAESVMRADAAFYARKGFRSVTTFGCMLDAEYVEHFGVPPVREYGRILEAERR